MKFKLEQWMEDHPLDVVTASLSCSSEEDRGTPVPENLDDE